MTRSLRAVDSRSPAVTRAVGILEELARSPEPMSMTTLARTLDLAKSTVANLCAALESARMIRRVDGRWTLDHKVVELGQGFLAGTSLVDEFLRVSATLPTAGTETVLLSVLDETDVVYLARYSGRQAVRLAGEVGTRLPASTSGMGKAMFAALEPHDLGRRLSGVDTLPTLTPHSLRTIPELLTDLEATRERGYAVDHEEHAEGVTCFGVPVLGGLRAAVGVTILAARASSSLRDALVADLQVLAARLSAVC